MAGAAVDSDPAWRHPTRGESRWWTALGMVAVGVLHLFLPAPLAALRAPQVTGIVVIVGAVVVFLAHPARLTQRSALLRRLSIGLLVVVAALNATSLVLLVRAIVTSRSLTPSDLLLGGVVVWLTNVAAFAYLFWEYDRGGPVARAQAERDTADLQFPQMTDPHQARRFSPEFVDYLYVSLTNALAFSPTDTMPLSRWCKALFALESLVSFGTIALVAARAINVLPS